MLTWRFGTHRNDRVALRWFFWEGLQQNIPQ